VSIQCHTSPQAGCGVGEDSVHLMSYERPGGVWCGGG